MKTSLLQETAGFAATPGRDKIGCEPRENSRPRNHHEVWKSLVSWEACCPRGCLIRCKPIQSLKTWKGCKHRDLGVGRTFNPHLAQCLCLWWHPAKKVHMWDWGSEQGASFEKKDDKYWGSWLKLWTSPRQGCHLGSMCVTPGGIGQAVWQRQ